MLKLAVIFALALGCHGVYVPSIQLKDGESPVLQQERASPDPNFFLYTQENLWHGIRLTPSNIATEVEANIKTIFIVHGHGGSYESPFNEAIRLAILGKERANVITMDWQALASNSYSQAFSQVKSVAEDLRAFIELLITGSPAILAPSDIQIVGFNLGAHLAGIAARGLDIARITGLDPSRENWGPNSGRLNQRDAIYVEVFHTDGGLLGNGIGERLGRVDVFVNGGSDQPGCYNRLCSHNRAHEVYAASITKTLYGYECASTSQLNLNRCRGDRIEIGNTQANKPTYFGFYRANVGRPPF